MNTDQAILVLIAELRQRISELEAANTALMDQLAAAVNQKPPEPPD
jgi:hypothetical protein